MKAAVAFPKQATTVAFLEQVAITCQSTWSYSNFNTSSIAQILQQRNYAVVQPPTNKQLFHPIFAQIPQLPVCLPIPCRDYPACQHTSIRLLRI